MKCIITTNKKVVEEVDIQFPIYRKEKMGTDDELTYYSKITEDMTEMELSINSKNEVGIRIGRAAQLETFSESRDYLLGEGLNECPKEEFDAVLIKILKIIIRES